MTEVINRFLKPTGDNSCMLLMMIGEQHKETFVNILYETSKPSLRKYFFIYLFENHEAFQASSNAHFNITEIELVSEPFIHPTHGFVWPIRADLNINARDYERLREQAVRGKGFTFSSFTKVDG